MEIDHESKTISDKVTVVGELEHVLYHARKSASVKVEDKELETFFQTVARMTLDFRRRYMKKHFPDCPEELWCLGKAVETARQRIYEADEGDTEDLSDIDAIWNMIWGRICKRDLSGCSSCKEDKNDLIVGIPRTDGPTEMTVEEFNKEFLVKPLGPDEDFARYIGQYSEGVVPEVLYRVSVDKVETADHAEHWAVAVYEPDGALLAMFKYDTMKEIRENWMFRNYPKKYKQEFEAVV